MSNDKVRKSCFHCYHGRRIDCLCRWAICMRWVDGDKGAPELIHSPQKGECPEFFDRAVIEQDVVWKEPIRKFDDMGWDGKDD